MRDEVQRVRAALGRIERGRGKRFPTLLRQEIAQVGRRLRRRGASWRAVGQSLGVPTETVRRLCDATPAAPAFTQVEVVGCEPPQAIVVVTPRGYRVEGLTVELAAELLGRLP